jgi:hypothetical protein
MRLREKRREPFFGEAVDRELLGPGFKPALEQGAIAELADLPPDLAELQTLEHRGEWIEVVGPAAGAENDSQKTEVAQNVKHHPDAVEKGTEVALGFMPHRGENRKKRLEGVKTWKATPEQEKAAGDVPLPTRREMFEQRKKHERGKLDPVLRRLQRERLKQK